MDELSRRIVDRLQGGFPLLARPFAAAAKDVGCSEEELLARLGALINEKQLTRFGPLYQIERMGGAFSLAALAVPEIEFERIAETVNAFPEVAHNYRRTHKLNMWFVLATEKPEGIKAAIEAIEAATGLTVFNFPKLREYYVGLHFSLDPSNRREKFAAPASLYEGAGLTAKERALVLATQSGLPLKPAPYAAIGAALAWPESEVIAGLQAFLARGIIRRIGVVPNHYAIGYRANGMTVWNVDDAHVDALGEKIGALPEVSHCYHRPRHLPEWPYNLFAMLHGKSRDEVELGRQKIAAILGTDLRASDVLYSTRILKKTGLRLMAGSS